MLLHIFYQIVPPVGVEALRLENWWPLTGKFSVAVFFLVSGFSLSIGFLATQQRALVHRMVLGRYVRLCVPVFAACAIMSVFLNLGWVPAPDQRPLEFAQLFQFDPTLWHLIRFSFFDVLFNHTLANTYAPPLWTISFEFIGSMVVAGLLLFVGLPTQRQSAYLAVAALLYIFLPWYFLFVAGLLIAALYQTSPGRMSPALSGVLIVLGLMLSTYSVERPHYLVLAASLFFLGAMYFPPAQAFFSTRFSRVLGTLSFPLYLIHAPIAFAVGMPIHAMAPDSFAMTFAAATAAAIASLLAAYVLIPVNVFAIKASRYVGTSLTELAKRRRPANG